MTPDQIAGLRAIADSLLAILEEAAATSVPISPRADLQIRLAAASIRVVIGDK